MAWAIKFHQALRFFPDNSVGYEYPELYNRIFGGDYEPDAYVKRDYEFARNHRYYMDARLVTGNDQYACDETMREVHIEEYTDIIGRQFKQPKEGLGLDNSPVAHMWRSITDPDRPL